MSRSSRDPESGAQVHEMSPDNLVRYERMKNGATGVGSRTDRDPWGWSTADANDAWPGRAHKYNPSAWPPPPKAEDK